MEKRNIKRESASLRFLYRTALGRLLLKPLCSRSVSRLAGAFMDSALSRPLIRRFVKKNDICLSDFEDAPYRTFNDCFTRKIRAVLRPVDEATDALISPCDALLSAYVINEDSVFHIKGSDYSTSALLGGNDALASQYTGGLCLVFRLCVHHYHRYIYLDDGEKGENFFIPGRLHTVRPIALERFPVFVQNCREYTVMQTAHLGTVTQIEVGAMLVGKIKNHHGAHRFARGEEKGTFLYGGSTIVLLLPNDARVTLTPDVLEAMAADEETEVKMGERIGKCERP